MKYSTTHTFLSYLVVCVLVTGGGSGIVTGFMYVQFNQYSYVFFVTGNLRETWKFDVVCC